MTNRYVFLVEDELLVAMELQDLIEEAGLVADGPYSSVSRAIEALEAAVPVCAVLDVRLRDGEIFPVADELAKRGVPLIFHSGHATSDQILARYPAATFYEKPCIPSQIVQAITKMAGPAPRAA
ncbi:response regulator [Falsirhodobacter sp. 20TX0035]|uniref:response regulator n=1 Tax=Falsirhodobacter sp. 20TX0035 TaxID=3022019 RepID=UPI002331533E|nr:response regulator [Falsirhodobacter sp. 20TX0035]MDB6454913.1 response regulator [Falsirhodobacter sp. 20TX0035]